MSGFEQVAERISLVIRAFYWLWLTLTAPLRLLVWAADAVIAVTAAVGIGLVIAWFGGWLPDDVVAAYAQLGAAKVTNLLMHAAGVGAPGGHGIPGRG